MIISSSLDVVFEGITGTNDNNDDNSNDNNNYNSNDNNNYNSNDNNNYKSNDNDLDATDTQSDSCSF